MSKNESNASKLPPVSVWEPESLRLTLFPKEEVTEQTWWKDLFGVPADKIDSQPKKLWHKEEGQFGEGKLLLMLQLGRIDWQYVIDVEKEMEAGGAAPFTLGEFPVAVNKFLEWMLRWFELQTCPSASRLAFGAVLLQQMESLWAGYHQIAAYLPNVTLYPEHMSDFMYRINKPRESKTDLANLKINRLTTWSVAGFIRMQSAFPLGAGFVRHFQSPEQFACRLELDINTTPEYQVGFTREQLSKVFHELVELGKEIAQKGDIL